MNLRERLRELRPAADRSTGLGELEDSKGLRDTKGIPDDPASLGPDMELCSFPTQAAPAFGTEKSYRLVHKQGRISLDTALGVPELGWRRLLSASGDPFHIERAVFLDLETTGLGRGTGTYAFLIGVGRFMDNHFRLRQFFMRDYDDESNVLEALRAELKDAEAIVTFNGRNFDWPLLETRATMNRLQLPRLLHLDLLRPARRLWRPIIGGCSLSELERAVLGLERYNDVPGYLIPQRYFNFLQTGDATPLISVLVHNRLDILSMVALVGYVGLALAAPRKLALGNEALSGAELFTIGRWLLPDLEGVACLEESLDRGIPTELRRQCCRLLATTYKRNGRPDDAVAIWESLTADEGFSTWAYIELAKHYEHRARDLSTARQWTTGALNLIYRRRMLRGAGGGPFLPAGADRDPYERELADILHRLQRIERKLGVS